MMRLKQPWQERLMVKFEPHPTEMYFGHPCWRWTGWLGPSGRGQLGVDGRRMKYAYRLMYERFRGAIPDGMTLDHLCRNVWCVNPDHLEPVTQRVNNLRGNSPSAVNARKTHCQNGHELSAENTIVSAETGYRRCRICLREWRRLDYYRKRGRDGI